jgi:hypothetical protein
MTNKKQTTVKAIAFGKKECMITIHPEGTMLSVNVNVRKAHHKIVLTREQWLQISTGILKTCFINPEVIESGISVQRPKIILPHN